MATRVRSVSAAVVALVGAVEADAHHAYAMFDAAQTRVVEGTVAKLEWQNPHVYVWVYVPSAAGACGFDLYAFENASINVLMRRGWTKTSLLAGDVVAVTYYPLRDGRAGGHFIRASLPDGRILEGAGGPGVREALP